MKTKHLTTTLLLLALCVTVSASTDWLTVFKTGHRVSTTPIGRLDSISYKELITEKLPEDSTIQDNPDDVSGGDTTVTAEPDFPYITENPDTVGESEMEEEASFDTMVFAHEGIVEEIPLAEIDSVIIGPNIPLMTIDIENGAEVKNKKDYLNAVISVEGDGECPDFEPMEVSIRGRGNTSLYYPKTPYRLKFSKKQSLCGLRKAKSFVLIANQIDATLMMNVVACEIARGLGMEFVHNWVPVNLMVNGTYRGQYCLSEKTGINSGSVDIDETTGVMWELDSYYDDEPKFRSAVYNLPVMLKDPDPADVVSEEGIEMTKEEYVEVWTQDFLAMERAVREYGENAPSDSIPDWTELMDVEALVDYLLVNNLAGNHEVDTPKSVFMYKRSRDSKYIMGPVWDFDWAFNSPLFDTSFRAKAPLFWVPSKPGAQFFIKMMQHPEAISAYKAAWQRFKDEVAPTLYEFIDAYTDRIYISARQNGERWPGDTYTGRYICPSSDIRQLAENLKEWMRNRIEYLDTAPNMGLY